ncbi:hypothetical protein ACF0H5_012932 [Mactra antiquata]
MSNAARVIPLRLFSSIRRLPLQTGSGRLYLCQHHSGKRFIHRTVQVCSSIGKGPPDDSDGSGNISSGSGGDGGISGSSGNGDKGGDSVVLTCPKCNAPFTHIETFEGQPRFIKCSNCHHFIIVSDGAINLKDAKAEKQKERKLPTPKEIKKFLDSHVVGQDFAKMILSVAVFNHYKKVNHNLKRKQADSKPETQRGYNSREAIAEILHMPMSNNNALGAGSDVPRMKALSNSDNETESSVVLEKSNILMLGPTGSGKTLLAQTLANILDVPFAICDCTTLTSAGYVGEDIESVICKLLQQANGNVEKCQQGIVFLDEVDKISRVQNMHQLKDVGGEGVQQAMLKMLEGTVINVAEKNSKRMRGDTVPIDTSNILFIAAGAFNGLEKVVKRRKDVKFLGFGAPQAQESSSEQSTSSDAYSVVGDRPSAREENQEKDKLLQTVEASDLIDFGLIPEFVGRMPVIVPLHSLSEDMLVKILTEPKNSLVKQFQECFSLDECQLEFTEEALKALAHIAMEKHTGARGLRSEVEKVLLMPMFEQPGSDIKTVIINEDAVKKNGPAVYIHEDEIDNIRQSGSGA